MRALTWQGRGNASVETVPDPVLEQPNDVIVEVTSTAICGSDLHLYQVLGPFLTPGDVLGHETMGVVVEQIREVLDQDEDVLGVESLATHRLPLENAPEAYGMFQQKKDGCVKVVLRR